MKRPALRAVVLAGLAGAAGLAAGACTEGGLTGPRIVASPALETHGGFRSARTLEMTNPFCREALLAVVAAEVQRVDELETAVWRALQTCTG